MTSPRERRCIQFNNVSDVFAVPCVDQLYFTGNILSYYYSITNTGDFLTVSAPGNCPVPVRDKRGMDYFHLQNITILNGVSLRMRAPTCATVAAHLIFLNHREIQHFPR